MSTKKKPSRLLRIGVLMMVVPMPWVFVLAADLAPLWTCAISLSIQFAGYCLARMAKTK